MTPEEIDFKQLKRLQQHFTELSEKRLLRMLDSFNMTQSDYIKLLPLFFHVNHPMLPGYVDKLTPCGIPNYFPSTLEKKIAKTISRSFEIKPRAYLKFDIAGLYLMGSTGTLGQSIHSDLDLWVCLSQTLSKNLLQKLQKKLELISEWMKTKGVELNCYLVFQEQFKNNSYQSLGKDNCGNTQNFLLLDEFYRTAIWLCGRQPLWWLVPPDEEYTCYSSRLLNEKRIEQGDWIDLGGITEIPASEYFSAALWQLYKAIGSPYKSSLKLLILEIYARYFPKTGLLSTCYKQKVYSGEKDINQLDPYVLILNYAEEFLKDQPQRLEFLRRAFYLKTGVKVNLEKTSHHNWRYQQLKKLVTKWRWKQTRLDYLNNRVNWRIDSVIKERVDLVRQLNHSYHFISNFVRVRGVLDQVSQSELVALGRMLYAVFERRVGKIECVNTGIVKNINESFVTIVQKKCQWELYLGSINLEKIAIYQPVYKADSFFSILAWCVCNRVINGNSNFQVYSKQLFYNRELANDLTKNLFVLVGKEKLSLNEKAFEKPAKIKKIGIYLNTDQDPFQSEKETDIYSVGKQVDGFCWGENQINLLSQFDIFWTNSWGETGYKCYSGEFSWIELFIEQRQFLIENENYVTFFSKQKSNLKLYRKRVLQLFRQWNKLSSDSLRKNKSTRYLMSIGKGFLKIDFVGKQINYKYYYQAKRFLDALDEYLAYKIQYQLDFNLNLPIPIIKILDKNVADNYHIYLLESTGKKFNVLIACPTGYVFFQTHTDCGVHYLINHYQQFFDSVSHRLNNLQHDMSNINFWHTLFSLKKKKQRFKRIKPSSNAALYHYCPIQAVANYHSEKKICFDLYTEEIDYFFRDFGELIYQKLVQHILQQRAKNERYPIFITDLDLSAVTHNATMMDYLEYKKFVEKKLARSLNRISTSIE